MILTDFIMILTEQPRSRAYIQQMIENSFIPNFVIYLKDETETDKNYENISRYKAFFDINKTVIESLNDNKIEYVEVKTKNCNDVSVINEVEKRNEKYVIFSAGGILKSEILNMNKKFIHIHPGYIPKYRGSTCFYYSIINENKIGATAFFMNSKIDGGDIILQREFPVPSNIDIDCIYDPFIRSELLIDILKLYADKESFPTMKQDINDGETYFVIHPVLKHLAMNKCLNFNKTGNVFWFIGLSGSGKSTLAKKLYKELCNKNVNVKLIDGDELRAAIGDIFGYSIKERRKSVNLVIFLAKTLSEQGINVIIANQGAFRDLRKKARREIINYNEIYVKCSLDECVNRDVKGFYKKAIAGEIKDFLGVDQKFDEPTNQDITIETDKYDIKYCMEILHKYIINEKKLY